jgi:hypothetical protein
MLTPTSSIISYGIMIFCMRIFQLRPLFSKIQRRGKTRAFPTIRDRINL